MDAAAHGLFHPFGWDVHVGSDAGGAAAAMASMHESMHDRLQQTTIWGCTITLLLATGESTRDEQARSTAMGMLAACRETHEQFATWIAMVAARHAALIAAGEADDAGYDEVRLRDRPKWIRIGFG